MSTLKSNNEDMTINADGASSEIILQQNGTEIGRIGSGFAGTSGQVLTSNGAGAAPTMQDTSLAIGDAFHAAESTSTSLTDSTWVKISLNTTVFDVGGSFDTANKKFQPSTAGYYNIAGQVTLDPDGSNTGGFIVGIWKNGTAYIYNDAYRGVGSSRHSGFISATIYLNGSSDYLELYCYRTAALSQDTAASTSQTFMSGHFVGV